MMIFEIFRFDLRCGELQLAGVSAQLDLYETALGDKDKGGYVEKGDDDDKKEEVAGSFCEQERFEEKNMTFLQLVRESVYKEKGVRRYIIIIHPQTLQPFKVCLLLGFEN